MINRMITSHPRLVLALCVMGLLAEGVFLKVGSRELTVFVVSFLIFVSVFFTLKGNENNRQCSNSSECVAQEPERSSFKCKVQDARYELTAHNEYEQTYNNGDEPSYPHRVRITGGK